MGGHAALGSLGEDRKAGRDKQILQQVEVGGGCLGSTPTSRATSATLMRAAWENLALSRNLLNAASLRVRPTSNSWRR